MSDTECKAGGDNWVLTGYFFIRTPLRHIWTHLLLVLLLFRLRLAPCHYATPPYNGLIIDLLCALLISISLARLNSELWFLNGTTTRKLIRIYKYFPMALSLQPSRFLSSQAYHH